LGFPDNALEPALSAQTIRIHYQLFQNYATGFNAALQETASAKDESSMQQALRASAFQGSGYALHKLYFAALSPQPSQPGMLTMQAIARQYGGVTAFQNRFFLAAAAVEGPGWAVLGWHPELHELQLAALSKHQDSHIATLMPILALDMWEHAYWLDYPAQKADYWHAWWNLIYWPEVENRLMAAIA